MNTEKKFNKFIYEKKLSELGKLISIIGHEFSNILNIVNALNQEMQFQKIKHPNLKKIDKHLKDAQILISSIKNFSKTKTAKKEIYNINEIVEEIVIIQKLLCKNEDIIIKTKYYDNVKLLINKNQIQQMLINLFNNARESIDKNGIIKINISKTENYGIIKIKDSGKGIAENMTENIFNDYFTTKKKTGTGLGLSIVKKIVKNHNGIIDVKSKKNTGAEFIIKLPLPQI
jgi:signal transduction histidine kinase